MALPIVIGAAAIGAKAIGAMAIGAMAIGATAIGATVKVIKYRKDRVLLVGKVSAGKSTIIHLMNGDLQKLKEASQTGVTENDVGIFDDFKFIDSSGQNESAFTEKLEDLLEHNKNKNKNKNNYLLYVFNASDYGNNKNEINCDINLRKRMAQEYSLEFKIIGTHGNQIKAQKTSIEQELKKEHERACEIFELIEGINNKNDILNKQKEILKFIKG